MASTTTASTTTKAERGPFKPFEAPTTNHTKTSLSDSSHIVTLPALPELYDANFLDVILPPSAAAADPTITKEQAQVPKNAFMEALKAEGNKMLTDNGSPAFKSTLDPALDVFSASPNMEGSDVHNLLHKSWAANPELTLRLIFCLRSIHDGKSEKNTFYHAFGWLWKKHPRTAIANLPMLVEPEQLQLPGYSHGTFISCLIICLEPFTHPAPPLGYYKDLLNILTLGVTEQLGVASSTFTSLYSERPWWSYEEESKRKELSLKQITTSERSRRPRGSRTAERLPPLDTPLKATAAKKEYDQLVTRLSAEPKLRALYIAVARQFAKQLSEDVRALQHLEANIETMTDDERILAKFKIGLAGKWAPTLGASHDRTSNIATAISQLLFVAGEMPGLKLPSLAAGNTLAPNAVLPVADAMTIRSYYRRWIISPLRRQIGVPETYMGLNQWGRIQYSRVPAVCMRNTKKLFFKHDETRFKAYLEDVSKGKKSIAGGTLLPNELLGEAVTLSSSNSNSSDPEAEMEQKVIEGQWNSLVDKLRSAAADGTTALGNCMALCDVSGSMGSIEYASYYGGTGAKRRQAYAQPIYPAIALSIIVSQLAKPPFQNTFITFSESPEIVSIDPSAGLVNVAQHMVGTSWGMNTDFQAVFLKLILPLAVKNKVPKEDMIKRLFVFSDMQFDEARQGASTTWTTDHDAIKIAYEKAGYDVPEIVYWNLSGNANASKPVLGDTPGTALLSGWSANLLKVFMDSDEEEMRKLLEEMAIVDEKGNDVEIPGVEKKPGMTPTDVMLKAVSKKSYDGLKVID
ncbi:hypothetical protein DL93DRAFT_2060520 [Clavulina sp. PMI_390]|nr:hypothetical protein DL93DRAFT_2060520 [Clavulina sp. PMI_390]